MSAVAPGLKTTPSGSGREMATSTSNVRLCSFASSTYGATRETVAWILRQIDRNEYKRRQAPVVLRVSQKAYGSGRRVPIVHRSGWGI